MNEHQVLLRDQSFDCVYKALFIGRHCRRPTWGEFEEIYLDDTDSSFTIAISCDEGSGYTEWEPSTKDILLKDWEILL